MTVILNLIRSNYIGRAVACCDAIKSIPNISLEIHVLDSSRAINLDKVDYILYEASERDTVLSLFPQYFSHNPCHTICVDNNTSNIHENMQDVKVVSCKSPSQLKFNDQVHHVATGDILRSYNTNYKGSTIAVNTPAVIIHSNKLSSMYFTLHDINPQVISSDQDVQFNDVIFTKNLSYINVEIFSKASMLSALDMCKKYGIVAVWCDIRSPFGRKVASMMAGHLKSVPELKSKVHFLPVEQAGIDKFCHLLEEGRHILSLQSPEVGLMLNRLFFKKDGNTITIGDKGCIEFSIDHHQELGFIYNAVAKFVTSI